jgi:hypothetical protein
MPETTHRICNQSHKHGLVGVPSDEAERRHGAPRAQDVCHAVKGRGGGWSGRLRIERQHNDALTVRELGERVGEARFAVSHTESDADSICAKVRTEQLLQLVALRLGNDEERRLVLLAIPDRFVLRQNAVGTKRQNEAVQNEVPDCARHLDHAAVGQELGVVRTEARHAAHAW